MAGTMVCNDCGDCCIDIQFPKTLRCALDSCCKCCQEVEIKIAPNQVLEAGTILGEITGDVNGNGAMPQTFKAFDPNAVDGSQRALVILKYDVSTDANGGISTWTGIWGCPRGTTKAYVCGNFDRRLIKGDLNAAIASGQFPARTVNGIVWFG